MTTPISFMTIPEARPDAAAASKSVRKRDLFFVSREKRKKLDDYYRHDNRENHRADEVKLAEKLRLCVENLGKEKKLPDAINAAKGRGPVLFFVDLWHKNRNRQTIKVKAIMPPEIPIISFELSSCSVLANQSVTVLICAAKG